MTNATPTQLRDAWLSLEAGLELTLTTTREHARASASMARTIRADTGYAGGHPPEEWDATAWAAQKLLDALKALPTPVLPAEPDPGQADILEELGSSTPGDKPGENVFPLKKGHW